MQLIAAIRSVLTYVGVSLYVLIVAPPGMLVAALALLADLIVRSRSEV